MPASDRNLLLGYDFDDGRVIFARNNPDRARHVVVTVHGVGSGLASIDSLLERDDELFQRIVLGPDDATLSVITWADYVAPQSAGKAKDARFAAAGAPRLASFVAALAVTAEQVPPRVTVLAHGYGGLVAGFAARDHGLDAAALVFLGCPGTGVDTVDGLRCKGAVYATPPDGKGDGTPDGVHGPRPDTPGFGAAILRSGPLSFRGDAMIRYVPELRRIIRGES